MVSLPAMGRRPDIMENRLWKYSSVGPGVLYEIGQRSAHVN